MRIKLWISKIIFELRENPVIYILLFLVLLLSFFFRVYRVGDLMGFNYDQGRDALVIWRFWNERDIFLVGPVTGLAGIFLGPFYYFLIAPLYLLGGGNPIFPAVFLAFLSTLAILIVYILGWKMHSREAGLIASTIAGFSYYLVLAGRWLANPTPILLTSVLLLWSMWKIVNKEGNNWWIPISILIGISLQLESASAFFYIPMIIVFSIWQKDNIPSKKILMISLFLFILTLLPQIIFNFIHNNILFSNLKRVFIEEKSFSSDYRKVIDIRLSYFWDVFSNKIFPGWRTYASLFSLLSAVVLLVSKKIESNKLIILFIIFLFVPMVGYVFFQGNYGNIYDYYMTGYYLPMVLLFSLGLGTLWKSSKGKIVVISFFIAFFSLNGQLLKNYLTSDINKLPHYITLENEIQAVNWIYNDTKNLKEYNTDVYVPPVISYSYDYLFLWLGTKKCGSNLCGMKKEPVLPIVYVLYEDDTIAPDRLENWLSRYEDSTIIDREVRFGGITVQRRNRI